MIDSIEITIKGLVQGVGFRPFIYRLAKRFDVTGWVENSNRGVQILAQGEPIQLQQFIDSIKTESPKASKIESLETKTITSENFENFTIKKSENTSDEITEISPDIAVCDDCLNDMKMQPNRLNYAFTNCTNCGPRFTIIKDLPYDRVKTTMNEFPLCKSCQTEYTTILDRRFHAQPVACNVCGPKYTLFIDDSIVNQIDEIIERISGFTENGKVIAIKGLGGFHLMCDALNFDAVQKLRSIKVRESKPFAVMFKDLKELEKYVNVNESEQFVLESWQRPIVLLKKKDNSEELQLPENVTNGLNTVGVFLPYMPIHFLLFEQLKTSAIVLTSGNFSDEPIIIDNEIAKAQFANKVDAIVTYNRDIFNRTDDSVVTVINNEMRMLRRSRGFVPSPVTVDFDVEGIVATGAELVNSFALGKGSKVFFSQHIGDLKNFETYQFYTETFEKLIQLFRIKPKLIVTDLHPNYLTSKFAEDFSLKTNIPILKVQHHHAHIAACMVENQLDEKVLGVSFDGVGYGTDGNIWGGEFLICDLQYSERFTHFEYVAQPASDKATQEPWRMAVSFLYQTFGKSFLEMQLPFLRKIEKTKVLTVIQAIEKNINCNLTSSVGRIFDAVAALCDVCTFSNYHAEAPMKLESLIDESCTESYSYEISETISLQSTFKEIVSDILQSVSIHKISAKFHNTMIQIILAVSEIVFEKYQISKVVLSGGVFQNKYLLENFENEFRKRKHLQLFTHKTIPSNDGGIALGQLAIAAKNFPQISQKNADKK